MTTLSRTSMSTHFMQAVAVRDNPELRGKPIAVAGSSRRAVVLTASY